MNHVDASLSFPSFPRFCGQTFYERKDKELGDLCVKAYNDWMLDEWCAPSNGRLIPLIIVQLWDPVLAAAEVRRNAAKGCHAVTFSEIPPFLGLPSIHDKDGFWDPFLAACEETKTAVCMHIGSSSKMPSTSPDAPAAVGSTLTYMNAAMSLTDWLMSGVFERFPDLTIAYSEGQIGWIPYVLERADQVWRRQPRLGWRRRQGAAPAVRVLLRARVRLLLRRRARPEEHRRGRPRQRDVRDGLPAQRLDVAAHEEGRGRDHEGSRPGDGRQDLPRQRDQAALARPSRLSQPCSASASTRDRAPVRDRSTRSRPSGSPRRSSRRGIEVVFGGADVGLMKVVADTALARRAAASSASCPRH